MSKEIERKWLLKGGDFSFPDKANVIREQLWQYYLEIIASLAKLVFVIKLALIMAS